MNIIDVTFGYEGNEPKVNVSNFILILAKKYLHDE